MRFSGRRGAVDVRLDDVESQLLAHVVGELLALLGEAEEVSEDPLAAMVGITTGDVSLPEDPALARLLPDAYGATDPEASKEFRRYTQADLLAGKRTAAQTLLATLPPDGGKVRIDRDQADAWLSCLNDLRLVLGSRLQVTEDTDIEDLPEEHQQTYAVYGWLGWAQESLLACLSPRPST